jgi:hypothetical protein
MAVQLPRAPGSPEQQYLAVLVARATEVVDLLKELRDGPGPASTLGGAVQRRLVSEPHPRAAPPQTQPVAEPAGRGDPPPAAPDPPTRPKGNAPTAVWRAYADALGLSPPDGASRADIITAVGRHTAKTRRPVK